MTGSRLFRFVIASCVLVGVCVGLLASVASARDQLNSVVPLFCSNDRIPANTELSVRIRWAVSNKGQLSGFLSAQKLSWAVYTADGATLLAHSAPTNPEFGDTGSWSAPGQTVGSVTNKAGDTKTQKFTYSDYQQATGVTVGDGVTVIVVYELSANAPTDDGFGWKFLAPGVLTSTTLTSSNPAACRVTGFIPQTP